MSTATKLITAEEFAAMPSKDKPCELVRGEIVEMNQPIPLHGYVCLNVGAILREFVKKSDLGRVFGNDAGVITERDPDTVRGPDVWYASYDKVPRGKLPKNYLDCVPDIAIEVLSPDDRWSRVLGKIAEFLCAGVPVVCVLDPDDETAESFHSDHSKDRKLSAGEELTFPEILPGFSVRVGQLFE